MRELKAVLALVVVSVLLLPDIGESQQRHMVTGTVLDQEHNVVASVWVRLYRGTVEIRAFGPTGQDGRYEVEFETGDPITLRYDDLTADFFQRRHPSIVGNLSGARDHDISKVMPGRVGHAPDKQTLLDVLSVYEQIYFTDSDRPLQGIRSQLRDRYKENIGAIKATDPLTNEWHQRVRALYDKWQP